MAVDLYPCSHLPLEAPPGDRAVDPAPLGGHHTPQRTAGTADTELVAGTDPGELRLGDLLMTTEQEQQGGAGTRQTPRGTGDEGPGGM